MSFRIHVALTPETVERLTARRAATGRIYLEINGSFFPEKDWDDFVFAVLAGWIDNAMKLRFPIVEVENCFMDGPLSFRLHRDPGSDLVGITLLRANMSLAPRGFDVRFSRYLAMLRGAAKQALRDLSSTGAKPDADVTLVQRNLKLLEVFEDELRR